VGTLKILAVFARAMTLFTTIVGSWTMQIGKLERLVVNEHQNTFLWTQQGIEAGFIIGRIHFFSFLFG
jgi:hypothetical protein